MGVNRPRHTRAQRKCYRAKLQRAQRIEAALALALRTFVLKGRGHIEDIAARRRIR
jgi:hypothetical protein